MLTPKQRLFVNEYLVDRNATQAAVRAGYSKRTANEQGSRLLANVSVSQAIEAATVKQVERLEVTADAVVAELWRIANAPVSDDALRCGDDAPTALLRVKAGALRTLLEHLTPKRMELGGYAGGPIRIDGRTVSPQTLTTAELEAEIKRLERAV